MCLSIAKAIEFVELGKCYDQSSLHTYWDILNKFFDMLEIKSKQACAFKSLIAEQLQERS